ncbi:hypothetical protein [Clostridium sp.]
MSECYDGKLCEENHKTLNNTVDEPDLRTVDVQVLNRFMNLMGRY